MRSITSLFLCCVSTTSFLGCLTNEEPSFYVHPTVEEVTDSPCQSLPDKSGVTAVNQIDDTSVFEVIFKDGTEVAYCLSEIELRCFREINNSAAVGVLAVAFREKHRDQVPCGRFEGALREQCTNLAICTSELPLTATDCNRLRGDVSGQLAETLCDGRDNDCDSQIDEGIAGCDFCTTGAGDDGNACTRGTAIGNGQCRHDPIPNCCNGDPNSSACQNNLVCTQAASMTAAGDCVECTVATQATQCRSDEQCVVDAMNPVNNRCVPLNCNDNNECTNDIPVNNACVSVANRTVTPGCCSAGTQSCTGGQVCTSTTGTAGACRQCINNMQCQDGQFCNGVEQCVAGTCQAATSTTVCTSTTPVCDEASDRCVPCTTNAHCNDNQFCNGQEVCLANNTCSTVNMPECAGTSRCDESNDLCVDCFVHTDCAGSFDACQMGACVTVSCADDPANCRVGRLDKTTGICTSTTITNCCRSPTNLQDEAACRSSRPAAASLPTNPICVATATISINNPTVTHYHFGCSTDRVAYTDAATGRVHQVYPCTSCEDSDCDEDCAPNQELCSTPWDDDGDGLNNETSANDPRGIACIPTSTVSDPCPDRGAFIQNVSAQTFDAQLGFTDRVGVLGQERRDNAFVPTERHGDTCYSGVYLWVHPFSAWTNMTLQARQQFCAANFQCENFAGQLHAPRLTQTAVAACECEWDGEP